MTKKTGTGARRPRITITIEESSRKALADLAEKLEQPDAELTQDLLETVLQAFRSYRTIGGSDVQGGIDDFNRAVLGSVRAMVSVELRYQAAAARVRVDAFEQVAAEKTTEERS